VCVCVYIYIYIDYILRYECMRDNILYFLHKYIVDIIIYICVLYVNCMQTYTSTLMDLI